MIEPTHRIACILFPVLMKVDESEFEKERQIQAKIEQLKNVTTQSTVNPNATENFILGIYIDHKLSEPINKQVNNFIPIPLDKYLITSWKFYVIEGYQLIYVCMVVMHYFVSGLLFLLQ